MSWREVAISELGRIVTGKTPETKNREFYSGEFPFITPSDINFNHYVCRTTVATVTDLAKEKLPNQFIPGGSVIVTCIGNTIGKVAIAERESLTNQQMNSIVVSEEHDETFVYYLMCHNVERIRGIGLGGGAATPILNKTTFSSIRVRVPIQKEAEESIAHILRAYDDLIANNNRRIELLEQSARELFTEWFVRLRYPGHEHDEILDGVPKGWRREPLSQLTLKIGSGATPRGGEAAYKEEGITLIRSQNVYDYRFEVSGLAYIDDEQADQLANVEVVEKDVLLNITGASVGRCCMVPSWCLPARVNQHVMIVRANDQLLCPYFLLCSLNSDGIKGFLLSVSSGGATREALTKDLVSRLEILVPSNRIMAAFSELSTLMFQQSETLGRQCRELSRARDLLLPRLMDGRLAV